MTAFCIESFKLLSEDPAETTNALLRILVLQQLGNTTVPQVTQTLNEEAFLAPAYCIQVNVLYFISLTLALSVASLCILGKQWIKEFHRDLAVSPRDALRIRQARFDALYAWKLQQILAALPVILQVALMLFFAGLLTQLWNASEQTTAGVVSVAVGLTVVIVLMTTIAPAYYSNRLSLHGRFTPFRSAQSWIFFVAIRSLYLTVRRLFTWIGLLAQKHSQHETFPTSWAGFDTTFLLDEVNHPSSRHVTSIHSALRWILKVIGHTDEIENAVLWSLLPQFYPSDLVHSSKQLTEYVLSEIVPTEIDSSTNISYLYYSYATVIRDQYRDQSGTVPINTMNLLQAAGEHALQEISADSLQSSQMLWDVATNACREIFRTLDDTFCVSNMTESRIRKCVYIPISWVPRFLTCYIDKMSIVKYNIYPILTALLTLLWDIGLPPAIVLDWKCIVCTLFRSVAWDLDKSSSVDILVKEVINHLIPSLSRRHRSISFLLIIGEATYDAAHYTWELSTNMFVTIDAMMVDLCSNPEETDGYSESRMEAWDQLRERFIQKTHDPHCNAPQKLDEDFFRSLHDPLLPQSLLSCPANFEFAWQSDSDEAV